MTWKMQIGILAAAALLCCFQSGCENSPQVAYNVNGGWLDVSGDGSTTTVTIDQVNTTITGTFVDEAGIRGTVAGYVDGDRVTMTYTYEDGFVVFNEGTVDDEGMFGVYTTLDDLTRWGTWSATRTGDAEEDVPLDDDTIDFEQPETSPGIAEPVFEEPDVPRSITFNPMFIDPVSCVITSEDDWFGMLAENDSSVDSDDGRDAVLAGVDFEEEMVIAVCMGEHSTGGYRVEIESIEDLGDRILVTAVYSMPGPDDAVTMAFTYPCASMVVAASDLPVEFDIQFNY